MAQPVNTYASNDMIGIREDLTDKIWNLTPEETPLLSAMPKGKAKQTFHEWQTDTLRASAVNSHIEGGDLNPAAVTPTVRLGNYTQEMTESATISDLDKSLDHAGRRNEMARVISKKVKEMKLDAEKALFANTARSAGSDVAGRFFASIQSWINTNSSHGSGGSAATGDGTDTRTEGDDRALTQAIFDAQMQSRWDNSSATKGVKVFLSSGQMDVANGFVGMNNQRAAGKAGEVDNYVDVYRTQWGTVEFEMSRECPTTELFILDMNYWKLCEQQGMRNFELAKTGTSTKRGMSWTFTLEACNEAASAMVADLS